MIHNDTQIRTNELSLCKATFHNSVVQYAPKTIQSLEVIMGLKNLALASGAVVAGYDDQRVF